MILVEIVTATDKILTTIVRNHGGLAISTVEQIWFWAFMRELEPIFQSVSTVCKFKAR